MTRSSLWIVLAIAALAAAVVLLFPSLHTAMPVELIRFEAQDPWAVGGAEDAFDYAGEHTSMIQGTAALQIDPVTRAGTLELALQISDPLTSWLEDATPGSSVTLRMQFREGNSVWTDVMIHGDADLGDSRLPMTHALYAGHGTFELLVDEPRPLLQWTGFWSIAAALRQSDGAIRNQGLVFTPLLRDQSVFSDHARMELTILLYAAEDSDNVILHLVFPDARALSHAKA